MIYYGDEVGLKGGNDPDCRKCMQWETSKWEPELVNVYRRLIHARNDHPALRCGDFQSLYVFNGVYSYMRSYNNDTVIVILNPREERQQVRIPLSSFNFIEKTWIDLLGDSSYNVIDAHLQIETLPSKKALVLPPYNQKHKLEIK
jgi:alpha-glucosidase